MCGIVGYIGDKKAYPILIKGLSRLEYRGYDSAGIALLENDEKINLYKRKGKVQDLVDFIGDQSTAGNVGIGHTRWATHGPPNDTNAHPHYSGNSRIALVHNGIIENYDTIKEALIKKGHTFRSDTDTEVLVHLIEDIQENGGVSLEEAVRIALNEVHGAYAIVVVSKDEPDKIIGAKKSSPLVVGLGEDEYYFASDATPIVEYTKNVVYLEDQQIAIVDRKNGLRIISTSNKEVSPYVQELEMELEVLEKGGYDHFMLKEIYEQPRAITDSLRGRLNAKEGWVSLGGIKDYEDQIANANRIIIIACGTSWHAGLVGEYYIEDLARIPVEVEYASEFRYRNPIIRKDDVVIAISQSGETADTIAALNMAKEQGATILGIVNVVGSTISRITDAGTYTHAGPEIGVASTKAFTTQVSLLAMMALMIGNKRGTIEKDRFQKLLNEMDVLPAKLEQLIEVSNEFCINIAEKYKDASNALFLGRGNNFPIALEGALKLKEISYIHAEGYPAAEMKHGPIALIDEEMPIFVIATQGANYEKVVSNIQEVKARKGKVIAIITKGDTTVKELADDYIKIPDADDFVVPILATIPFQLMSYHIAVMRNCNVDQPRNLAKSVTVE